MPILAISVLGYFLRLNFDIDRLSKFPLDCPSKLPGESGHEQICHEREREREMLQGSSKTGIEGWPGKEECSKWRYESWDRVSREDFDTC